jgi:predicted DNA-binding helix-hairpin-helix protein
MIVGATNENDLQIIKVADHFYKNFSLKRVYYSGYVPVLEDKRLPALRLKFRCFVKTVCISRIG